MTDHDTPRPRLTRWRERWLPVRAGEGWAVFWSFAYFFSLLGGYYILRPVRDEMGIRGGVDNLQWLFTGTFLAMTAAVPVYGWLAARYPRRTFVPLVYGFFILNVLLFFAAFRLGLAETALARAFFIWTSVFNLFVVSVFWSFMADTFSQPQAERLFGFIAAGGSAGAIVGPAAAGSLAPIIGPVNLLPVAAALLATTLVAVTKLRRWQRQAPDAEQTDEAVIGGGAWAGVKRVASSGYLLGIAGFIMLYTTLSTFLYFEQAHIVEASFDDSALRTTVFAWIDFAVNALTIGAQLFVTHQLVHRFGVGAVLAAVPALLMIGFGALAAAPVLATLVVVQVVRRAGNYAVTRPAREMLFTVLSREDKYKSKNVVDTVIYRAGDAVAGWIFTGLMALGLGLSGIALVAVPLSGIWAAVGLWLGRHHRALRQATDSSDTTEQETSSWTLSTKDAARR